MRKGVLTAEITTSSGEVVNLASRMYSDNNSLYRGHIQSFSQKRVMSDAFTGRTVMAAAKLVIHNESEAYDSVLFDGTADIRIGAESDTIAQMESVMLDAPVVKVARTDETLSVSVLDGQYRGSTNQQKHYDTSAEGFGHLLNEFWGWVIKAPLTPLDGDTGTIWACAGPIQSFNRVYTGDKIVTTGFTAYTADYTARLEFATKPEGNVFVDAYGLGTSGRYKAGALLYDLLTRQIPVCQGMITAWSGATMTLDENADLAAATLVGKTVWKLTPPARGSRTIVGYDSATRIATLDSAWGIDPVIGTDMYSIEVNTDVGGFSTSQVDSTGFDALDVTYPNDASLVATGGISTIQMQDKILDPLLCHLGPRRDGIVQLKRLAPSSSGTSVGDITRIIGDITRKPLPIYWSVEARYRRDNTGGHWKSATEFDATIKADNPSATAQSIDVPFITETDARTAAAHWLTCFGEPTELATMKVDHDLSQYDLGDVVTVYDDRYQFSGGIQATIVGMTDVFDGHDTLTVWVPMQ